MIAIERVHRQDEPGLGSPIIEYGREHCVVEFGKGCRVSGRFEGHGASQGGGMV